MRKIAAILGVFVALSLAWPATAASNDLALAVFPPAGRLDYRVIRDGDQIGTQSVEFVRQGEQLTVRTRANALVTFLGIPVYRFTHEAEEQWLNGRLVSLTSRTDDDGEPRAVAFKLEGDRLRGTYNGRTREFPAGIIPASLWHPDTVRQTVLLDPARGRDRQVTVADKGEETIKVKGQPTPTRHYAITGQINREVWYGPDGQLVQIRFPFKDGSQVLVTLR